jgi:hypothetical protein
MYLNTGQDAGPDPDWDPVTRRWTGYDKRRKTTTEANHSQSDNQNQE